MPIHQVEVTLDDINKYLEECHIDVETNEILRSNQSYFNKLQAIKRWYEDTIPRRRKRLVYAISHRIDIYSLLSPIEINVYNDMKYLGFCMYPQFPVLNYFVDFADPNTMVGIEVDSKAFHTDHEKDKKRHQELEKEGWTIYHITGSQTYKDVDLFLKMHNREYAFWELGFENEEDYLSKKDELYTTTSIGMLVCIKRHHYPEKHNFEGFYAPEYPEMFTYKMRQDFLKGKHYK